MHLPSRLAARLAQQHGVFSTAQATEAGVHPRQISQLVACGEWVRLRRGAYTLAEVENAADDVGRHLLRARAAHLTLTAAHVFSHVTAAVAHGLPIHDLPLDELHVTHVDGEGTSRHESGVWHHGGRVPDVDRTLAADLPVLGLARTAFDVARVARPGGALVVADAVLRRGVSKQALRDQLEAGMDWPGARAASHVLPLADGRSESVGESLTRLTLHELDLPPDELQLPLMTDVGEVRLDFAWTRWRVAGEFDGKIKYGRLLRAGETAADVAWRERRRELAIERAEWSVVRFGWVEHDDPARLRHLVLGAIARSQMLGFAS
jgi:hypothetical protein